jgi:hypothetical protein
MKNRFLVVFLTLAVVLIFAGWFEYSASKASASDGPQLNSEGKLLLPIGWSM